MYIITRKVKTVGVAIGRESHTKATESRKVFAKKVKNRIEQFVGG